MLYSRLLNHKSKAENVPTIVVIHFDKLNLRPIKSNLRDSSGKTVLFLDLSEVCYFSLKVKRTVMQIDKTLINDRLRVSKVSWEFRIPIIYNFAVIYP